MLNSNFNQMLIYFYSTVQSQRPVEFFELDPLPSTLTPRSLPRTEASWFQNFPLQHLYGWDEMIVDHWTDR